MTTAIIHPFYLILILVISLTSSILKRIWKTESKNNSDPDGLLKKKNQPDEDSPQEGQSTTTDLQITPGQLTVKLRRQWRFHAFFYIIIAMATYFTVYQLLIKKSINLANINFLIIPLLLSAIISTVYFVKTVLIAPTKFSLVIHVGIIIYEIIVYSFFIHRYFDFFYLFLPFLLGPLRILFWKKEVKPLWDHREKFTKIINFRVELLFWVLCVLEVALQYKGYSLIVW
jgi:uncharacterized Tic20 family protein